MPLTATHRDEKALDSCRESLDRVIQTRIDEEWGLEDQAQQIRRNAVRDALAEGFPISSVSEASGMTVSDIEELLAEPE